MEWLQKADKMLSEEGPVHGDLDTVNGLIDQHKQFEDDLKVSNVIILLLLYDIFAKCVLCMNKGNVW